MEIGETRRPLCIGELETDTDLFCAFGFVREVCEYLGWNMS